MCIAVPGLVIEITGDKAKIDYQGNIIEVHTGIIHPKIGDYCLIHAGCAIEIIDKQRAGELNEIISLLEEVLNED